MLKSLTEIVRGSGNVHVTQPSVVSITQSCETGTVYQLDEIQEISKIAHKHKMSVHMDGARFRKCSRISWRKPGRDDMEVGS